MYMCCIAPWAHVRGHYIWMHGYAIGRICASQGQGVVGIVVVLWCRRRTWRSYVLEPCLWLYGLCVVAHVHV